jgi:hypothetical protein
MLHGPWRVSLEKGGKEMIAPGCGWAPQVHAMRYANALLVYCRRGDVFHHTSSVNLLPLLPSREAGVSLLANAAVWLGVQDGVPEAATLAFWTLLCALWIVGRLCGPGDMIICSAAPAPATVAGRLVSENGSGDVDEPSPP